LSFGSEQLVRESKLSARA